MRNRTLIVLLLAIACGTVAGYSAWQLLQRQPAQAVPDQPDRGFEVVVARREMPIGTIIGEEDVKLVDWPGDAVPEGFARTIPDVVGRGLKQTVVINEPLLDSKLMSRGTGGGLQITIPDERRAFTIRVDEVSGVAGFINPGNRVDVIITMNPPGGRSDPITRTILQNMEVLARGSMSVPDPEGNPIVVPTMTLNVTPQEAEQLGAATMNGIKIQLALRNPIDVKEIRTNGFRQSNLLNIPGAPRASVARSSTTAPPVAGDGPRTIEIVRGGKRSLIKF